MSTRENETEEDNARLGDITMIVEDLRAIPQEDRMRVFERFCVHCGAEDPDCQCWNDE